MKETDMHPPIRHVHPALRSRGVELTVLGAALFFVPIFLPRADPFADVHVLVTMARHHLWWQFAGVTVFFVGNTLRLIGVQGHPGLPWPSFGRRIPPELVARIQLRRRAFENRAKALAGEFSPVGHRRR